MNKPRKLDNDFKIRLHIAEGALNIYWAFDGGETMKITKGDELQGRCSEMVGWDGYCEFEKLTYEYKRDIVKTLIGIKKKDNLFNYM